MSKYIQKKRYPRILCISPLFAPTADSEAFCAAKMVMGLMQHGFDVTVLCMQRKRSFSPRRYDDSILWKPAINASIRIQEPSRRGTLNSLNMAFKYHTDSWARWVGELVKKAVDLHRERPFDLVYSRSLPSIAHIAAYWVVREIKRPWVGNINDPWDDFFFPGYAKKISYMNLLFAKYWMRKTLKTADLLFYPCPRLRDYMTSISGIAHRSEILPHIGLRTTSEIQEKTFKLVHAGTYPLDKTGRSPDGLLNGLRRFLDHNPGADASTRLILVGPTDELTQAEVGRLGLESTVISTGRKDYQESLEFIATASMCVLIEQQMAEGIFLPSKLADYIVANKPVLALSPQVGTVADIGPNRGICRCNPDDESAIEAVLCKAYEAFKVNRLHELRPDDELVANFEEDSVCRLFSDHIQGIVK